MDNVLLDFDLTDDQLVALNIHSLFRANGVYEIAEEQLNNYEGVEKIVVWFDASYNDNTYDVDPVMAEFVKNNKVIAKVKLDTYKDLEIKDWNKDEGILMSFIIKPSMLEK